MIIDCFEALMSVSVFGYCPLFDVKYALS